MNIAVDVETCPRFANFGKGKLFIKRTLSIPELVFLVGETGATIFTQSPFFTKMCKPKIIF